MGECATLKGGGAETIARFIVHVFLTFEGASLVSGNIVGIEYIGQTVLAGGFGVGAQGDAVRVALYAGLAEGEVGLDTMATDCGVLDPAHIGMITGDECAEHRMVGVMVINSRICSTG